MHFYLATCNKKHKMYREQYESSFLSLDHRTTNLQWRF